MSHAQVPRKWLNWLLDKKNHDLILADRRLNVREIAETVGISKHRMGHILDEILGIRKLSARWVPRLLTPDNKRIRETTSEQCLMLFMRNPKEFLRRFVTVDEIWIRLYFTSLYLFGINWDTF